MSAIQPLATIKVNQDGLLIIFFSIEQSISSRMIVGLATATLVQIAGAATPLFATISVSAASERDAVRTKQVSAVTDFAIYSIAISLPAIYIVADVLVE